MTRSPPAKSISIRRARVRTRRARRAREMRMERMSPRQGGGGCWDWAGFFNCAFSP